MKNCIVAGFGRSGTSLMGGILHQAGYFMGDNLYPPRHSNPKGFFEDSFINRINERLLATCDMVIKNPESDYFDKAWSPFKPDFGHRWLSWIEPDSEITCSENGILSDIQDAVSREGFAYKDPRFNYTLNVWGPFLGVDTVYICMFREPAVTIQSVLTECASADYLSEFYIDRGLASELWINSYRSLLRKVDQLDPGRCIFVNYEQLLRGEKLGELSELLDIRLSDEFVSRDLNRTEADFEADPRCQELYYELCELTE